MLESSSGFGPQNDRLGVVKGEKKSYGPRTPKKQPRPQNQKAAVFRRCSLSDIASAHRGSKQYSCAPRERRMGYHSAAAQSTWLDGG